MALSKASHCDLVEKINSTKWSKDLEITIQKEETEIYCWYSQPTAVSIELINHLLGGPNMDYVAINLEDSFQAFEYSGSEVFNFLKTSKQQILYFEHRKNTTSDILLVATEQPKSKGQRQHVVFKAVIRFTLLTTPKVGFCRYFDLKVCKPAHASTLDEQVKMLTTNIFPIIYGSEKYVKKNLLNNGYVYSLQYPGYRWKFIHGGPQTPKNYVADTPTKVEKVKKSLFTEDTSPISESDEDDSTLTYALKVTTKRCKVFKFRKISTSSSNASTSSQGSLPSLPKGSPIVRSSDEELERSMVAMEQAISLEMESD